MIRFNSWLTVLILALTVGCADAPARYEPISETAEHDLGTIDHAAWELASAGCEDADLETLELFICEDEPSLGALVAGDGEIVCVDSLDLLVGEIADGLAAADPSPQPSYPGRPDMGSTMDDAATMAEMDGAPLRVLSAGSYDDPTPTPVVQADPTPTPVTNPSFNALPIVDSDGVQRDGGEEEDPTPTPTMEQ